MIFRFRVLMFSYLCQLEDQNIAINTTTTISSTVTATTIPAMTNATTESAKPYFKKYYAYELIWKLLAKGEQVLLLLLLLSRFSRVRLCDPIDSSPLGSSVPGILQARTLEWVAISFSNA